MSERERGRKGITRGVSLEGCCCAGCIARKRKGGMSKLDEMKSLIDECAKVRDNDGTEDPTRFRLKSAPVERRIDDDAKARREDRTV